MNKLINQIDDQIYSSINTIRYDDKIPQKESIEVSSLDNDLIYSFLEQPPSNISNTTYKDLLELEKLTKYRTGSQLELALKIDDRVENIFTPYLEKLNLSFPREYVDIFWDLYYPVVTNIKYHFNRARPWQIAEKHGIEIDYVKTESSLTPSYPSGHATYGYILQNILSEMYPLHSTNFEKIAELVGFSRKVLGIHHDSDILAAKKLTSIIYPIIKNHIQKEM